MATRDACDGVTGGLPPVLPFEVDRVTRLSWELGSRTVEDDHSSLRGRWSHTESRWTLSVYEVTSATDLLCVETPVGRERFYGAARMDLDPVLSTLDDAPEWDRTE
jgi:hypothetical protein